ncbi:MAG: uracil-DNA glycosylase [Pseudomonadota bacterium]
MTQSLRNAAFLEEMGIAPLWSARAPAAGEPALLPAAPPAAAPLPYAGPSAPPIVREFDTPPAPAWDALPAVSDAQIGAMDWDELQAGVASCTRCSLCKGGRPPVPGRGARSARWLVVAGASNAADAQAQQALAGEPGHLLDNMLAAAGHALERDTWLSNVIKCRPASASGGERAPTADEAAACRPWLERELVLCGATMVLTLGQIAANTLQGKPLAEPLAGARGQVHVFGGVPQVATLHPGELLRRGADKALAWADLCRATAHDASSG